jgi:hypothetical protein
MAAAQQCEWSRTVVLRTEPAAPCSRLASPVHTVLCHVERGHAAFRFTQTHRTPRSHRHPPGHHAAPPCGQVEYGHARPCATCPCLFAVLCSTLLAANDVRLVRAAVCHLVTAATCSVIASPRACIHLDAGAALQPMHRASKQRDLRTRSPESTIAAFEPSPTKGMLCAEHGSLDGCCECRTWQPG